jgi:DNA-binding HxlR family transcriptional regulator
MRWAKRRSDCPISFALDIFGDRWSLLVMRDLLLQEKEQFGEFLGSEEKIATNILADRLQRLEHAGLVKKVPGPSGRERTAYLPTDKGKDLIPLLLEMLLWSAQHDPKTGAPEELVAELKQDKATVAREVRRAGSIQAYLRALSEGLIISQISPTGSMPRESS